MKIESKTDLKTVIEDVRARDAALISLMLFADRQAMLLFRTYVPIGIAAGAVTVAGFLGPEDHLFQIARWAAQGDTRRRSRHAS